MYLIHNKNQYKIRDQCGSKTRKRFKYPNKKLTELIKLFGLLTVAILSIMLDFNNYITVLTI